MRMSEQRIQSVAKQIAKALVDEKVLSVTGSSFVLESDIARAIQAELAIEDEIDKEVTDSIARMKRQPPQGSAEWQAMFHQLKEEAAKRRNYIL